jgi:glycosyltransferase involved in cell wall biosynthesis
VLGEPDLAARLGRAGRRRAQEELSWPRSSEQFARLLAQVAVG